MTIDREKFLEARRSGIGGSDIAAILGLSKWRTALEVYKRKTGELVEDDSDSDDRRLAGQVLQKPIIDLYCQREGVELIAYEPELVRHREYPFLIANLDAVVRTSFGDELNLDAKNVHWRVAAEWGEEGSDRMPDDAFYQGHAYNFITGRSRTDFAVLLGGEFPPRVFSVPRDDEFFELLLDDLTKFWWHVKQQEPPPPDFAHRTTVELMKRLYPDVDAQKQIVIDGRYAELAEKYWILGQIERAAGDRRDALKAELLFALGDAASARIDGSPIVFKRTPIPGGAVVHFVKEGYVRFDCRFPKGHQHLGMPAKDVIDTATRVTIDAFTQEETEAVNG